MMKQDMLDTYVRSALRLQGYALDEEAVQRVIAQFTRIEEISRAMRELPLPSSTEPAAVFRP